MVLHACSDPNRQTADDRKQAARDCQNALFNTDPNMDREKLISNKGVRVQGTCEWIKQYPTFCSWLNGETPLLWISGGPGKGKTIMSIYLTQYLEDITAGTESVSLLYYFCNHQDENRNTAVAILRSLIYQIVTRHPPLIKYALPYFVAPYDGKETLKSLETLWVIFGRLVKDAQLGTLLCVVDGLDECNGWCPDSPLFLMDKTHHHLETS
jgi:Cdc6-like AAA superfamily ATPase